MDAMTATTFALVVTFCIIGSSLLTSMVFLFIMRYRRRRKQAEMDQYENSPYSYRAHLRSLSSQIRSRKSRTEYGREQKSSEFAGVKAMDGETSEWNFMKEKNDMEGEIEIAMMERDIVNLYEPGMERESRGLPRLERKSTLPYDPSDSSKPPRFRSWLTESFKTVSRFGDGALRTSRSSREIKAQKKKEEEDEIRKMAMRKVREGEERRGLEKKRRESEERRMRARQENEEVERRVSLRRQQTRFVHEQEEVGHDPEWSKNTNRDSDTLSEISDIGTAK